MMMLCHDFLEQEKKTRQIAAAQSENNCFVSLTIVAGLLTHSALSKLNEATRSRRERAPVVARHPEVNKQR